MEGCFENGVNGAWASRPSDTSMKDPTLRFSDRVENYIKYRPSYPRGVVELLCRRCGLGRDTVVADIGAGTGIFARLLLGSGCRLFAVEPNREMREAAIGFLAGYPGLVVVDGTAEDTKLATASIDLITAAQAFHWFDPNRTKQEFRRIARPDAWTVLVWNTRLTDATPFLRDYESLLLRYCRDYSAVDHRKAASDRISPFFSPAPFESATFDSRQRFDLDSLIGRLLSSSYAPNPGEQDHEALMNELRRLFDLHQQAGGVEFLYKTEVYFGRPG